MTLKQVPPMVIDPARETFSATLYLLIPITHLRNSDGLKGMSFDLQYLPLPETRRDSHIKYQILFLFFFVLVLLFKVCRPKCTCNVDFVLLKNLEQTSLRINSHLKWKRKHYCIFINILFIRFRLMWSALMKSIKPISGDVAFAFAIAWFEYTCTVLSN